jgi:hypothetical protein
MTTRLQKTAETVRTNVLGSNKFDTFALMCSTLYFVFFITTLGCIISGKCSAEGMTAVTVLKIVTLILPTILFAKLLLQTIGSESGPNNKLTMARFQLGILLAYFFLVFIFLCAQAAGNTEAVGNINTLCLYILPIFIMASFYSTYEMWQSGGVPKSIIYLNLVLAILYYSLFYFSLELSGSGSGNGSVFGEFGNDSLNGILIAIAVALVFLFAYQTCFKYNQTNWKLFKTPAAGFMSFCEAPLKFISGVARRFTGKVVP